MKERLRRIERLERAVSIGDEKIKAIFITVVDGRKGALPVEVRGWKLSHHSPDLTIMRENGEDDKTLQNRAIQAFMAIPGTSKGAIPIFLPVHEDQIFPDEVRV